jgi:hypothetical protein
LEHVAHHQGVFIPTRILLHNHIAQAQFGPWETSYCTLTVENIYEWGGRFYGTVKKDNCSYEVFKYKDVYVNGRLVMRLEHLDWRVVAEQVVEPAAQPLAEQRDRPSRAA